MLVKLGFSSPASFSLLSPPSLTPHSWIASFICHFPSLVSIISFSTPMLNHVFSVLLSFVLHWLSGSILTVLTLPFSYLFPSLTTQLTVPPRFIWGFNGSYVSQGILTLWSPAASRWWAKILSNKNSQKENMILLVCLHINWAPFDMNQHLTSRHLCHCISPSCLCLRGLSSCTPLILPQHCSTILRFTTIGMKAELPLFFCRYF